MKYRVVTAEYSHELVDEVDKLLETEWKCQGGVSVVAYAVHTREGYDETNFLYAQSMVLA